MNYKREQLILPTIHLDSEGYKGIGNALQYDDLAFNLFSKKLFVTTGKVDYDWDRICLSFQPGGDITNKNDCAFGNEPYGHKWKASTKATDYISMYPHFHWLQFNASDQYEVIVKYRILNNGTSYVDDDSNWEFLTVKTCNGHDVIPFHLDSGDDFMVQITEFAEIERFIEMSAEFQVRLTRTDSTNFSKNLLLTQFDLHCPIDSFGSVELFKKYE